MISGEGSGKWVFAVFIAIALVVTVAYPNEVLFMLKFTWDLVVQNVRPLIESLLKKH